MTDRAAWTPCRLVPMDASSPGHHVASRRGLLVWPLVSRRRVDVLHSSAGNAFHVWRDFLESVPRPARTNHLRTDRRGRHSYRAGWPIVDYGRRHEASFRLGAPLEGRARRVARRLRVQPGVYSGREEARVRCVRGRVGARRVMDRRPGLRSQRRLLPGFAVGTGGTAATRSPFDLSPDGQWVVFETLDTSGKNEPWLAPLDRRSPPRQIPMSKGTRRCSIQTATSFSAPANAIMALRTVSTRTAPACRKSTSTRSSKTRAARRTGGGSRFTRARRKNGRADDLSAGRRRQMPCWQTGPGTNIQVVAGWSAAVHHGVWTTVRCACSARPAAAEDTAHRLRVRCGDRRAAWSPADRRRGSGAGLNVCNVRAFSRETGAAEPGPYPARHAVDVLTPACSRSRKAEDSLRNPAPFIVTDPVRCPSCPYNHATVGPHPRHPPRRLRSHRSRLAKAGWARCIGRPTRG